jgi:PAS domain S-box-containing protein
MRKIFRWNDWPVLVKLIVAFVVLADLSIVLVNTPIQRITRNNIERDTQTHLLDLARLEGQQIGQELAGEINLLETALANKNNLRLAAAERNASYSGTQQGIVDSILALDNQWTSQPLESNPLIDEILSNDLSEELRSFIEQNPEHLETFVTDQYGATIAATGVLSDYYQADEEWWQAAWNDGAGAIYISEPVYDESARTQVIEFAMPVRNEAGEPIGVIKDAYDAGALSERIDNLTLGETGHSHLLGKNGALLAASELPIEQTGQSAEEALLLGGEVFSGEGAELNVELEGEPYIVSYAPVVDPEEADSFVNDLGWVVTVLQTEAEALATLRFQQRLGFGITFGASLLAIVAAVLIARSMTRSIDELEKVFRQAAIGNFEARAKIYGDDEIGRAADAVNHMLEQFSNLLGRISKTAQQRFDDIASFGDVWELDLDGRFVYVSEPFAETLGMEVTDILGRFPNDFIVEEHQPLVNEVVGRMINEKQSFTGMENDWLADNGKRRITMSVSGLPILDEDGNVTGMRGVHTDITAQRKAEQALRESQSLMDALLRQIPDWVFVKDTDYRYILANNTFADQFANTTPEELIGKTDYDIGIPTRFIEGDPETGDEGVAYSDKAAAEKGQTIFEPEKHLTLADGVEHILEAYKLPFHDARGNIIGVIGVVRDITEGRAAEIALRESQALLDSILSQIPDAIYVKDTNYRYVAVNEPFLQMTNRRQEDLIGKTDEEAGFAEDPQQGPEERERIRQQETVERAVIEEGTTIHISEFEVISQEGAPLILEMTRLPFHDDAGNIIGLISTLRDVTAQRQVVRDVEAAAEQVTAATGSMFDIVELLLNQASATAEMAADATQDAETGDEAVNNTITAMVKIRENTQESARRIKRLGESAQEITEAVRLIEEIADRTTVLALNASIQAASAGEAGRGFAVVAEEVQRLAERATGATRQIEETVKSIQAGTNEAVFSIEEATRDVVVGSDLAKGAGAAMEKLHGAIDHLATLVQHMAETTASQTSESLGTLNNLSHELQASVSGFRVGDSQVKGNGREATTPALRRS